MGRTATLLVGGAALAAASLSFAQDAPIPTLKTGTSIVAVSAVVHDKSGRPVPNLTHDDFILKQEGQPQPIRYFSQGSELPLTLALMVDTSSSQRAFMPDQIAAGRVFFPAVMTQPQDRGVLVQFDCTVQQLASMTSSVQTLRNALDRVRPMTSNFTCEGHSGGTLLYDAVVAVSRLELGNQTGRRAMVILTDGDDHGSRAGFELATEAAQRANAVIYAVYCGGLGGKEQRLEDLSRATGGGVFAVSKTMSLQQIFAEISDDLRMQYQLGYRAPDTRPNRFHRIDLKTKDKTLIVQARNAYFTPK